jgi:hypothetical protein
VTLSALLIRSQTQPVTDDELAAQVGTSVDTFKKFKEQAKGAGGDESKVKQLAISLGLDPEKANTVHKMSASPTAKISLKHLAVLAATSPDLLAEKQVGETVKLEGVEVKITSKGQTPNGEPYFMVVPIKMEQEEEFEMPSRKAQTKDKNNCGTMGDAYYGTHFNQGVPHKDPTPQKANFIFPDPVWKSALKEVSTQLGVKIDPKQKIDPVIKSRIREVAIRLMKEKNLDASGEPAKPTLPTVEASWKFAASNALPNPGDPIVVSRTHIDQVATLIGHRAKARIHGKVFPIYEVESTDGKHYNITGPVERGGKSAWMTIEFAKETYPEMEIEGLKERGPQNVPEALQVLKKNFAPLIPQKVKDVYEKGKEKVQDVVQKGKDLYHSVAGSKKEAHCSPGVMKIKEGDTVGNVVRGEEGEVLGIASDGLNFFVKYDESEAWSPYQELILIDPKHQRKASAAENATQVSLKKGDAVRSKATRLEGVVTDVCAPEFGYPVSYFDYKVKWEDGQETHEAFVDLIPLAMKKAQLQVPGPPMAYGRPAPQLASPMIPVRPGVPAAPGTLTQVQRTVGTTPEQQALVAQMQALQQKNQSGGLTPSEQQQYFNLFRQVKELQNQNWAKQDYYTQPQFATGTPAPEAPAPVAETPASTPAPEAPAPVAEATGPEVAKTAEPPKEEKKKDTPEDRKRFNELQSEFYKNPDGFPSDKIKELAELSNSSDDAFAWKADTMSTMSKRMEQGMKLLNGEEQLYWALKEEAGGLPEEKKPESKESPQVAEAPKKEEKKEVSPSSKKEEELANEPIKSFNIDTASPQDRSDFITNTRKFNPELLEKTLYDISRKQLNKEPITSGELSLYNEARPGNPLPQESIAGGNIAPPVSAVTPPVTVPPVSEPEVSPTFEELDSKVQTIMTQLNQERASRGVELLPPKQLKDEALNELSGKEFEMYKDLSKGAPQVDSAKEAITKLKDQYGKGDMARNTFREKIESPLKKFIGDDPSRKNDPFIKELFTSLGGDTEPVVKNLKYDMDQMVKSSSLFSDRFRSAEANKWSRP